MENDGDTKITVQEWVDFLNSQKQTFMSTMNMDIGFLLPLVLLLIYSIASITRGTTHWILGVLGILLALLLMSAVGIHASFNILFIHGISKIQHEILKGELKEVKDISKKYFSLVRKFYS